MNKNETQKTESVLTAPAESPLMAATESPLMIAAELVKANGNMDVSKLKELLELQERYDATQAKKAYVVAMAEFKKNPPEIIKDKMVKFGNTKYSHATLPNVTTCINKALSEHGLHSAWITSQANGSIKVTCKITHVDGHSEETGISAPPDKTGSKNDIQGIGSTITYLERYTLLALTGLATADQDNDGAGAGKDNNAPTTKPTKKDEQDKLVDHAFFEFETANQPYLNEHPGVKFDVERFKEAIIKHFKSLPTRKESISVILERVKPEECTVETRDDRPEFPNE